MRDFLIVMSGWLAATTFGTVLFVAWGVNALRIWGGRRRRFMMLHLALGIAVPLIGLAHGLLPLCATGISGLRTPALALGSSALLLLLLQAALGISLRIAKTARPQLRTAHFATMLALAGLIAVHIFVIRA